METAIRIYRRYLILVPEHVEEFITYLQAKVRQPLPKRIVQRIAQRIVQRMPNYRGEISREGSGL